MLTYISDISLDAILSVDYCCQSCDDFLHCMSFLASFTVTALVIDSIRSTFMTILSYFRACYFGKT